MDVHIAIKERRAYRALDPIEVTDDLINELAEAARLAPSCFNNQPWHFIFVRSSEMLKQLFSTLSWGNKWIEAASLIVIVFTKKDFDCVMPAREYYLFDTGMATAFLILRATELGLVAHPIAGYDEAKVKNVLDISEEMTVITLVNIGKHSDTNFELLSEKQTQVEKQRPSRKPFHEFMSIR